MSIKDHLPKAMVDALYEPDAVPEPKLVATAPAVPWNPSLASVPVVSSHTISTDVGTTSVLSSAVSSILSDLRTKTDFDATPIGQQLKGCMDALADTGLSDEQKSKTAMKLSHQSPSQVVSVLQGLQGVLTAEKQKFDATMQTATTIEVGHRQASIADLQSKIAATQAQLDSMRQQKAQLDAEVQEKQTKISTAQANYTAAFEARNTELAEMISHYQSIPEGN